MKRYLALLVCFIAMLLFAACDASTGLNQGKVTGEQEPGIVGYVMHKVNNGILVVNPDPFDFSANGGVEEFYEAIWFSNAPEEAAVGNQVRVWFDIVRDSYPAQSDILEIEVLPSPKPDGAVRSEAEALQTALSRLSVSEGYFYVVQSVVFYPDTQQWEISLKEIPQNKVIEMQVKDQEM